MEDVGAQVATPIFIHPSRFCEPHPMAKKRSLPFQTTNFSAQQQQQQQQQLRSDNWNPNAWHWDSMRFIAKPLESDSIRLGTTPTAVQTEPSSRAGRQINVANPVKTNNVCEDDESLRLKLGGINGGSSAAVVEPATRPSKRVRSGSPGGASYPMCQVDDCKEDLSNAKDYHRRHKVCEVHSKATKALVGKQMQRFCQQCSRFHPLSEFDEGKRSCRRRLAGHNRRRRKTQPEDATPRVLLPGNRENTGNGDLDIVNLLAVLARAQGSAQERGTNFSAVPDKDQLIQILSKLNLPLPAQLAEKLPIPGSSDRSISNQVSSQGRSSLNGNTSSPSTMDLLAALSATPAAPAPDVPEIQSEGSNQMSDSEKSKSACTDQATCLNLHNGLALELHSVRGERSSSSNQSPVEDSDSHVQEPQPNLPLQLFSSSPEIDSIPKLAADKKYFSSGSSNPSVDRSPSSSPPVMQKLFPMPTLREMAKPGTILNYAKGNANVAATRATGRVTSLQLFGGSSTGADNTSSQSSPYQAGYTSSSGSDHSPSSLNSDAQDRTGRIIFKLFDKDPSHLPGTLRAQIYNWLSNSPSEMESYIRPGCIVLSIYVSMSSSAWDQLEENLYQCVKSLINDVDSDFWQNGRFLVHTQKQLASHKGGKIRLCKSWQLWSSPELISVSPVAIVSGQETSLLLRGRNLTIPGTRVSCTCTASYTMKQVSGAASPQTTYDEISLGSFRICGADTSALGRCFIEVENGFRSTSFPVIIADAAVCRELSHLEFEISGGAKVRDAITANDVHDSWAPRSREETLHFLNELGWLFQRKSKMCLLDTPDYKICRFKFLFVFSVEHDFCALVKTLLDILLEINLARQELAGETLEMLSEIQLLNRAVKRRRRNMVNLLLHYSVIGFEDASKKYIFPPNLVGPGGITPLHLAASMSNSDDLVDALTSDPQEIGLRYWNSLLDSNGLSPYEYASRRNNHSYNRLVAQKLADKENLQVSVTIGNEIESLELEKDKKQKSGLVKQGQNSCSKCAVAAARFSRRIPGSQGLLQRPYIHSMLAIAAVCVCVCLLFRGAPDIGSVAPFKWEKLDFGPM